MSKTYKNPSDIDAEKVSQDEVEDIGYGREFVDFYDRIFLHDEYADIAAEALRLVHPDPSWGTLELGVGTGRIALPLSRRIGAVDAMDSSAEMLAELNKNSKDELVRPLHGNFVKGLPDRQYGLIFGVCQTLSMVQSREEQRITLENVFSALRPGGVFVVETGNPTYIRSSLGGQNPTVTTTPLVAQDGWLTTYSNIVSTHEGDNLWKCRQIWIDSDGDYNTGLEQSLLTPVEVLDALAHRVGFVPEQLFADWLGNSYQDDSPLYIRIFRRPLEETTTAKGVSQ